MSEISIRPRRGRPCAVCALPAPQRTALELALVDGTSISRISRGARAPSRDSIRRHIASGHLPAELQHEVERVTGLDSTTILARIHDIAQRARTTALEAAEASNHTAALKAGDAELRALAALSAMGATNEGDVELALAFKDTARATFVAARRSPEVATAVAVELDALGRPDIAEDVLDQISETRELAR